MADFFSNLVRQVLGDAPEVEPMLPPRFASWPGIPLADVAPRPQEPSDAPARADAALLPLPLIDPDSPAASAPLPTFRQMSELRSASGPPVQPGQPPVAQDRPETADFEQGDVRQEAATPVRPAMDDALLSVPPPASPSSPTSPASVTQAEADSDTDGAVVASPAPRGASGDRPSKEMATTQWDQAAPHPPSPPPALTLEPAPRPAAGQERSASSARLPDPPARMGGLLRDSQAEPVDGYAAPVEAEAAEAQPCRVETRPEPVQARTEPIEGRAEFVEARPEPVRWQPEPAEARRADMPVQPLARAPASAPHAVQPAASVPAPVLQREAASGGQPVAPLAPQAVPATEPDLLVSAQATASPATTAPASAPHAVQPAASVPAPVAQRQAVSGGQPVAPLAPQAVPATEPDLPVSTQARATPATPAPALTTDSLEPAPPAGRAAAGWREPALVPAPEPAPGEMGSTTRAEAGFLLRPPSARQATGEPEPAPTVRVTIGRVVVRASPEAERAPARRVELPRPPVSLEEYLQGRQGGTR